MYYGKTYIFGKTEMFAKNVFYYSETNLLFPLVFAVLLSALEGISKVTQSVLCYYLQTITAEKNILYHR